MFECDDLVLSVALYPSGIQVAACTEETLYVWDTATQLLIASEEISECLHVAVSNDGKSLAVGSFAPFRCTTQTVPNTLDCIWSHDLDSLSVS